MSTLNNLHNSSVLHGFTQTSRILTLHDYTVSQKKETPYSCPYLRTIFADSKKNFATLSGKFEINRLLKIPPYLKCVATLPCEILMSEN